jgi:hypothetical protein
MRVPDEPRFVPLAFEPVRIAVGGVSCSGACTGRTRHLDAHSCPMGFLRDILGRPENERPLSSRSRRVSGARVHRSRCRTEAARRDHRRALTPWTSRRWARARAGRVAPRSLAECSRRSRARLRSAHGAEEASRSGRCHRAHHGSGRTRQPHRRSEGGRASAVPTRKRTPTRRRPERKPHGPHFATKMSLLACRPATAPRAPIPTGEHEVPVRCGRLLVGGRPVAEQAPLV